MGEASERVATAARKILKDGKRRGELVRLVPADHFPQGNEGAISILKDALKRAKRGETTGVVVLETSIDGKPTLSKSRVPDRHQMISALNGVLWKLTREVWE